MADLEIDAGLKVLFERRGELVTKLKELNDRLAELDLILSWAGEWEEAEDDA